LKILEYALIKKYEYIILKFLIIKQLKDLKPELKMTICEKLLKPAESYKPREVKNQEKLKSLKLAFEQKDRALYRKFDGIIDLVSYFNTDTMILYIYLVFLYNTET
jgi:hypothetical protein